MKILISGMAGFIGFNLAMKLKSLNHECIGFDNFNNYYDVNLKNHRSKILKKNGINCKKIDLLDKNKLNKFIKSIPKIDYVIHLAAQAGVRYSLKNPDSYINSNIIGTFNLLEAIKLINVKHFLFASTSSVYGKMNTNSFFENEIADHQLSLYASTKKSCESLLHSYSYNFSLPVTCFRFFTVYGPWGRPDMALFKFIDAAHQNKQIEIFNYGKNWRDFTFIDDLTTAISKLLSKKPNYKKPINIDDNISNVANFRVVNIGNKNPVNLLDFIKTIENILEFKFKKKYLPMQQGDVQFTSANTNLLKTLTGYIPDTKIEIGIKKFYDWYIEYNKISK